MKLGFIGTGNMAGAIMGGIIKKGIIAPEEIIGSDIMEAGRERAKKEHGIHVTADNIEVTQKAEVLVLSVKPQFYAQTIAEIKDAVREDQLIITIAPGKTLAWLEEQFGKKVKIVRTMPNTPALVGEGMTAACPNDAVTEEEKNYALELLSSFGKVEIVPEHLIDAVVASPEVVCDHYSGIAAGLICPHHFGAGINGAGTGFVCMTMGFIKIHYFPSKDVFHQKKLLKNIHIIRHFSLQVNGKG